MPPKCRVCHHSERNKIDRLLIGGSASLRDIAGQFDVSRTPLSRHRKEHLASRIARAVECRVEADVSHAVDIAVELQRANAAIAEVLDAARSDGDAALTLRAVDRLTRLCEAQGRLIGLIKEGATVNLNIDADAVRIELAAVIQDALQDFPEARIRIAERLDAMRGGAS